MKPYIYIARSTVGARDLSRQIPTEVGGFVRVALHFPDTRRSLEVWADGGGRWSLDSRPAPAYSGPIHPLARGILRDAEGDELIRVFPDVNGASIVLPGD